MPCVVRRTKHGLLHVVCELARALALPRVCSFTRRLRAGTPQSRDLDDLKVDLALIAVHALDGYLEGIADLELSLAAATDQGGAV